MPRWERILLVFGAFNQALIAESRRKGPECFSLVCIAEQ